LLKFYLVFVFSLLKE